MRVALCMFGQPRLIKNPYSLQSHMDWIIKRYNADVYAHCWISGQEVGFGYSDWVKVNHADAEDKDIADIVLNNYNPKRHLFEEPRHFALDDVSRSLVSGMEFYSPNNENNMLSHLYSFSTSLGLIEGLYDWVIISRYDNYIRYMPNLEELNSNKLYITTMYGDHFPDPMIFGGQRHMESLRCYDIIPELCHKVKMFIPESFKRAAFYRLGELEEKVRLEVGLVRSLTLDNLQI